jgi:hypothetical protein
MKQMNEKNDNAGSWIAQQGADEDDQRAYGEDLAIVNGSQAIARAIESAGITRTALAERLGCHKSFVTRVLGGPQNMTLATMGAFLWGCGYEVNAIEIASLGAHSFVAQQNTIEVNIQTNFQTGMDHFVEVWNASGSVNVQPVEVGVGSGTANNNLALAA